MKQASYDESSGQSIFEFAMRLTGSSLSQMVSLPKGVASKRNRGDLGTLVEKYYFEHVHPKKQG